MGNHIEQMKQLIFTSGIHDIFDYAKTPYKW